MKINKRSQTKLLLLPIIIILLAACEKVVYPPIVVDNVKFNADILPILSNNCSGCHPPTKDLDLTEAFAYNELVPKYAAVADSASPKDSKLYIKLTGSSHKSKTTDIEKEKILDWISQGVPNN